MNNQLDKILDEMLDEFFSNEQVATNNLKNLDENYKKDLVEYLVNRIKPAHSNSIVRIKKDRC